jgi:hypothetical protein
MNSKRECLLSDSEWQRLSQVPDPSFPVHKSEALLLKSTIAQLFLEVSKLLREGEMICPDEEVLDLDCNENLIRLQIFYRAIASLYARLESSYESQLKPLITNRKHTHQKQYSDILLVRLECGVSAALAKLQQLGHQVALKANLTDTTGLKYDEDLISERIRTSEQALQYVKSTFPMSAKPLEFGLRQLWSRGGFGLQRNLST